MHNFLYWEIAEPDTLQPRPLDSLLVADHSLILILKGFQSAY